MKYSVSSRQQPEYLKKCDEIKVLWNDRKIIFDLVEKYPGKTINLCKYMIHEDPIEDWDEIENYKKLTQDNFIMGVSYSSEMLECSRHNISFYYLKTLTTFDELNAVVGMGASMALIGGPIFFKTDILQRYNIEKRVAANCAIHDELPHADGVCGSWIRPEDVKMYEPYIDVIEFQRVNLDQERALFRIYAEQHKWSGDLGMIIQDLNYLGVNRMIPSTITERRLTCGQRCQENGLCHLCWRALNLADPDLLKDYQKATQ